MPKGSPGVPRTHLRMPITERIESHIVSEMSDDNCWETDFKCTNRSGHPKISLPGTRGNQPMPVQVHVIAWEAHYAEPVPEGLIVRHTCDNPRCCNPHHLILGTRKDNTADMISRGRAHWQK